MVWTSNVRVTFVREDLLIASSCEMNGRGSLIEPSSSSTETLAFVETTSGPSR
jgi:hypothetical protein